MKPLSLIRQLRAGAEPVPGYLFLGAEPFYRSRCRKAILEAALGEEPDETAIVEIDLAESPLSDLIEEAQTMSLFCSERVVIGRNAEHAVPRTSGNAAKQAKESVSDYFRDPSPGTVVLIEVTKFDSRERDEKRRLLRAAEFFDAVPTKVTLDALTGAEARNVGKHLAKQMGLDIPQEVLGSLVDMLGADAFRIENELHKLELFAGGERQVTRADLEELVPEARHSGVFEFSQALAAQDREKALALLDTMAKAGMYWPMQLNLIAGLFRQALAAKELGLQEARQITARFKAFGLNAWPDRARQLEGIVARFGKEELRDALVAIYEADRSLRSPSPDDRIAVQMLVMKLTR